MPLIQPDFQLEVTPTETKSQGNFLWVGRSRGPDPEMVKDSKSRFQIIRVHNSSSMSMTFDDIRIFHTLMTWSTFWMGSLAWIHY